ncbi:hypothetical protein T265_07248 [Opisthorchis viverrini]|uniref:Uncharacterized protein n=1 Tax=Opisthorchis viverrini TaxID=6198 RepID=A0A074ZHQ0_OPIVI|nr:hypothetical protein T265_07248 [Opisthorchis viverrini]KER25262.1 hypothetical protein T265_07248 [Opisthorchis viverrini]
MRRVGNSDRGFVTDTIMEDSQSGSNTCGVEVLTEIEYTDDGALLGSDPIFGMRLTPAKCKVLLQDWIGSYPSLMIAGDPLEVVDQLVYLGSCISLGGPAKDHISIRIRKAREASVNLRQL